MLTILDEVEVACLMDLTKVEILAFYSVSFFPSKSMSSSRIILVLDFFADQR